MNILILYLLGLGVTGLAYNLSLKNDAFYTFFEKNINEAKSTMLNKGDLSDGERVLLEGMDANKIMNYYIGFVSIFSWLGLIPFVADILIWVFNKNK